MGDSEVNNRQFHVVSLLQRASANLQQNKEELQLMMWSLQLL